MLLTAAVGIALGLLISALVRTSEMATSLVPLILIPQILFSGLVGVPAVLIKASRMLMPAAWSFDTMKRYSTLDTLEEEGAVKGRGLYKNIEVENDKIIADAKSDLKNYKADADEKLEEFENDLKNGRNVSAPTLDEPPKIADAKKIPENLNNYMNFLHPWMHEIVNQIVLMLMFFMLVIATLLVLRLQDTVKKRFMKNLLSYKVLFLILAVSLSVLTACKKTANSENSAANENAPSNNTAVVNKENAQKPNDYPPIAEELAQTEIRNLDDSTFKLADKKGKVLLLNLWATWCGPCRAEMPHLVELEETYKDKGLEIIGLNTDEESLQDINSFVGEMKLNYHIAWADSKLMRQLVNISKFQGIPQSYLIDREGRLRGVFLGGGKNAINKLKETTIKVVEE